MFQYATVPPDPPIPNFFEAAGIGNFIQPVANFDITEYANVALPPGRWDLTAIGQMSSSGSPGPLIWILHLSIHPDQDISDTVPGHTQVSGQTLNNTDALDAGACIANALFTLAAPGNVYLKVQCDYPSGSPAFAGRLSARRVMS